MARTKVTARRSTGYTKNEREEDHASSDEETAPKIEEKTPRVKKGKTSQVAELQSALVDFLESLMKEQTADKKGRVKVADVLEAFKGEENQDRLTAVVKLHQPKEKRTRRSKDPNAPKRPRTSYILFCKDKRPELKEDEPELKGTEITSKLGELWREMTPKQKKKYTKEAAKDKARYEEEMKDYTPPAVVVVDGKVKKRRKKKGGPKRPCTAYIFFSKDKRAEVKEEHEDWDAKEVTRELGRLWREDFTDEKSRKKWIKMAKKDKERYEKEKAEWVDPDEEEKVPQKKRKKAETPQAETPQAETPQEDSQKKRKSKKSKKKEATIVRSGMIKFCAEERPEIEEEHPDWDEKKIAAELKRRWSELDEEEREVYNEE